MILKNYSINITIRIILIIITCFLLVTFFKKIQEEYYYTTAGLAFLLILQGVLLVNYLNKINKDLALFFNAVQNNDSTLFFTPIPSNKTYSVLQKSLNEVNTIIQKIKSENEKKSLYLKNIIDQVDVSLLAFNQEGELELINNSAQKIIGAKRIRNINDIKDMNDEFLKILFNIKPGENKILKTVFDDRYLDLSIKASIYRFDNQEIKLVSFQNIKAELEKKELESWQKLIRILNHEIMNSLSPVLSLTKTLINYLKKDKNSIISATEIQEKTIKSMVNGLETIEETSIGLIDFINNYRSISTIPAPNLKPFKLEKLIQSIYTLMENEINDAKINFEMQIEDKQIEVVADFNQISQVLINLVKNAVQSLNDIENGKIEILGYKDDDEVTIIKVIDNGKGIPSEIIDDIFIPFFTTRNDGSGIGLSMSRQIMRLHNGSIQVQSQPGNTCFILKF